MKAVRTLGLGYDNLWMIGKLRLGESLCITPNKQWNLAIASTLPIFKVAGKNYTRSFGTVAILQTSQLVDTFGETAMWHAS